MSEDALKRDAKGRLVAGTPPGPGRPKGYVSIKDKVRQYLEDNPSEVESIVKHFVTRNRELMWQMLEGRPQQDLTSAGEALPSPIYAGLSVQERHSDEKDIPTKEEN
jgi:hypothetical protein